MKERSLSEQRASYRARRHRRVRGVVQGAPECPRLVIFRSNRHIYAQLALDEPLGGSTTLTGVSTLTPSLASEIKGVKGGVERARAVGKAVALAAKARGVSRVRFDRGGYLYHGAVKALADAAREAGLEF